MIDKSDYKNIEIPEELDAVVNGAIAEGKRLRKRKKIIPIWGKIAATAAVFVFCFVALLNLSPAVAEAANKMPIIGNLCRVLTFREYHFEDNIKYIDAKIPKIKYSGKSDLERRVNLEIQQKINDCLSENEEIAKDYYEAFIETGGKPEDFIPIGITVDYEIKCANEEYVSFVISQYETSFNAYNHEFYYNIDLESGKVLTLKDLYGNEYKEIAAESIESTIDIWNDEQKEMLWNDISISDLISENTDFYINENNQIIIVFEKYEVAYGAAGAIEFVIEPSTY